MIYKKSYRLQPLLIPVILILLMLVGCASKKNLWGDPKTGLILTYRTDKNQILQYKISTGQTQNLEVMGQSMQNLTKSTSQFSVQLKEKQGENLLLGMTIDSMMINIKSQQGNFSPDLSAVIDKGFEMILSPLGEELEFIGIDTLQYDMGPGGRQNLKSTFRTIFPNLPNKPVKIGDTWPDSEDFQIKEGNFDIHMIIESENTFSGFETVNRLECMKVTATFKGTMEGEGEQMGNDMEFTGSLNGNSTWYFAYKKGFFVNMTTDFILKADIEMSGAQNMTIPMTQETKVVVSLIQ